MIEPLHSPPVAVARKPRDDEIDVFGLTHPGKVRKINNDHFLLASIHKRLAVHGTSLPSLQNVPAGEERVAFLAMVADGVGGSERGEVASRVALEAATQYVNGSMQCYYQSDAGEATFVEALHEAAMQTHASVVKRAEADPETRGMATTLTLFLGVWPWQYVVQVGDSRYYIYREGVLTQVSRDQTMAQELFDQGVFNRTDAFRSKWAHVLSSAIGGQQTAPVVTRSASDWRNIHLLCSDGLTKHVSDARIAERLGAMTSARQVTEALLQDALEDGGSDNITIIVGRLVAKDAV
jgi:protein phosphatase